MLAYWPESGNKKTGMTAGKLAIPASEKHSVKRKPSITPKAAQVPDALAALGEELQKATPSGSGTWLLAAYCTV